GLGGLGGGGIQRIQLGHELDLRVKPLRRRQTLHDLAPAGHWSPPDTCRARRAIWLLLSLRVTYLLAHTSARGTSPGLRRAGRCPLGWLVNVRSPGEPVDEMVKPHTEHTKSPPCTCSVPVLPQLGQVLPISPEDSPPPPGVRPAP